MKNSKKKRADQAKERRKRKKELLLKMTDEKRNQLLSEVRMKCRQRVRNHRHAKKINQLPNENAQPSSSYRTKSAKRKAATKIRKSLPLSPQKRNEALSHVVHSLDIKDQVEIFKRPIPSHHFNGKELAPEIVGSVEKFYQDDEISRMSPNVKDCRIVFNKSTGQKETVQIRHLNYTLSCF